jgi:hypothetical protein
LFFLAMCFPTLLKGIPPKNKGSCQTTKDSHGNFFSPDR